MPSLFEKVMSDIERERRAGLPTHDYVPERPGFWESTGSNLAQMTYQIPKSLVALGEMAGIEGAEDTRRQMDEYASAPWLNRSAYQQGGTFKEHITDPNWWGAGVGGAIPTIASSMIPGALVGRAAQAAKMTGAALKAARFLGASAGAFPLEAGSQYTEAKDELLAEGADRGEAERIARQEGLMHGAISSAMEGIPAERFLSKIMRSPEAKTLIGKTFRDTAKRLARETSMQAVTEGATEGAQEISGIVSAMAGRGSTPEFTEAVQRTVESALIGAATGGLMGSGGGSVRAAGELGRVKRIGAGQEAERGRRRAEEELLDRARREAGIETEAEQAGPEAAGSMAAEPDVAESQAAEFGPEREVRPEDFVAEGGPAAGTEAGTETGAKSRLDRLSATIARPVEGQESGQVGDQAIAGAEAATEVRREQDRGDLEEAVLEPLSNELPYGPAPARPMELPESAAKRAGMTAPGIDARAPEGPVDTDDLRPENQINWDAARREGERVKALREGARAPITEPGEAEAAPKRESKPLKPLDRNRYRENPLFDEYRVKNRIALTLKEGAEIGRREREHLEAQGFTADDPKRPHVWTADATPEREALANTLAGRDTEAERAEKVKKLQELAAKREREKRQPPTKPAAIEVSPETDANVREYENESGLVNLGKFKETLKKREGVSPSDLDAAIDGQNIEPVELDGESYMDPNVLGEAIEDIRRKRGIERPKAVAPEAAPEEATPKAVKKTAPKKAKPEKQTPATTQEQAAPKESPKTLSDDKVKSRVSGAYEKLKEDWNRPVRIAEIKKELSDVPADAVDRALKDMDLKSSPGTGANLVLMAIDTPDQITREDRDAAIDLGFDPAENPHLVYMNRPWGEWTEAKSEPETGRDKAKEPAKEAEPAAKKKTKKQLRAERRAKERIEEDEELSQILNELNDKASKRISAGLDPEIVVLGTRAAAIYIKKGYRNFRDFAYEMYDRVENWDKIKDHLRAFWVGTADLQEFADVADEIEDVTRKQARAIIEEIDREAQNEEDTDREAVAGERDGQDEVLDESGTAESGISDSQGPESSPDTGQDVRDSESAIGDSDIDDGVSAESVGVAGQSTAGTDAGSVSGDRDNGVVPGTPGDDHQSGGQSGVSSNYELSGRVPIRLTKGQRRSVNEQVRALLDRGGPFTESEKDILRQYTGEGGLSSGSVEALNQHYTSYEVIQSIYDAIDGSGFDIKKALEPSVGSGNFLGFAPNWNWTTVDIDPTNHKVVSALYPNARHYLNSFERIKESGFDAILSNVPFLEQRTLQGKQNRPDIKALHDFYFVHALDLVKDNGLVAFITSRGSMDKKDASVRRELMKSADLLGAFRLPSTTFEGNTHTSVITDIIFLQKRPPDATPSSEQAAINDSFIEATETTDGIVLNNYYHDRMENLLGAVEVGKDKTRFGKETYLIKGVPNLARIAFKKNEYETKEAKAGRSEEGGPPKNSEEFFEWIKKTGYRYATTEGRKTLESGLSTRTHDATGDITRNLIVEPGANRLFAMTHAFEFSDITGHAKVYEEVKSEEADKILALERIARAARDFQESHDEAARDLGIAEIKTYQKTYRKHPKKDQALKRFFKRYGENTYFSELGSFFKSDFEPSDVFKQRTRYSDSGRYEAKRSDPAQVRAFAAEDAQGTVVIENAPLLDRGDLPALLQNGYSLVSINKDLAIVQNDVLYYSGNIYEKLDDLDVAARSVRESGDTKESRAILDQIEHQRSALEAIMPERKMLDDIRFKGVESWIRPLLEQYGILRVEEVPATENRPAIWGHPNKIIQNYLNNYRLVSRKTEDNVQESMASYMSRVREAEEVVAEFIDGIKRRARDAGLEGRIQEAYNRRFRNYVKPDYSKAKYLIQDVLDEVNQSPLAQKIGIKQGQDLLRKNQIQWIIQAVYEGRGINGHDVGGGKTMAAIALARVLKKRGAAKKPIFVVPAKTIEKWRKETKDLFPDASVVSLGNLAADKREQALFEYANTNADYTFISVEGFEKIKLLPEDEIQFIEATVTENALTEASGGRRGGLMEQQIQSLIGVLHDRPRNTRLTFDKLGVDMIVADEAHNYKNVGVGGDMVRFGLGKKFEINTSENKIPVKADKSGAYYFVHPVTGERVEFSDKKRAEASADRARADAGIPKVSITLGSARAYDFRFKANWVAQRNNGKNVFLLTATPTPNKPLEVYTLLRHLDADIFSDYGIYSARQFADVFFKLGTSQDPIRNDARNILQAIVNAQELRGILNRYVDKISMEDMPWIKVPARQEHKHYFDASPGYTTVSEDLQERIENLPSRPAAGEDTMGAIYTGGRSASIDPRLYGGAHANVTIDARTMDSTTDKIQYVIEQVSENLEKNPDGGQLIFLDMKGQTRVREGSMPEDLHAELKRELLGAGLKPSEIGVINGRVVTNPDTGNDTAVSGEKKDGRKYAVSEAYNAGKMKVLIGDTQSMGEGMDLQVHTTDIWHVDIPYTPGAFRQREGRGVRYGNKNDSVNIHYLFQRGTFDSISFNTVVSKRGWNDAIWDKEVADEIDTTEEMLEGGIPEHEQIMIEMASDPDEKARLMVEYSQSRLGRRMVELREGIRGLDRRIMNLSAVVDANRSDLERRQQRRAETVPDEEIEDEAKRREDYERRVRARDQSVVVGERHLAETRERMEKVQNRREAMENEYNEMVAKERMYRDLFYPDGDFRRPEDLDLDGTVESYIARHREAQAPETQRINEDRLESERPDQYRDVTEGLAPTDRSKLQSIGRKLFGDDWVRLRDKIVTPKGREVLGRYNGLWADISLGMGDPESTIHHEAVHRAEDLFLTERELSMLKEAEPDSEKRAEGIVRYMREGRGFTGRVKRIIDRMFRRIRRFLRRPVDMDSLFDFYDRLLAGEFAARNPLATPALPMSRVNDIYESDNANRRRWLAPLQQSVLNAADHFARIATDLVISEDPNTPRQKTLRDGRRILQRFFNLHSESILMGVADATGPGVTREVFYDVIGDEHGVSEALIKKIESVLIGDEANSETSMRLLRNYTEQVREHQRPARADRWTTLYSDIDKNATYALSEHEFESISEGHKIFNRQMKELAERAAVDPSVPPLARVLYANTSGEFLSTLTAKARWSDLRGKDTMIADDKIEVAAWATPGKSMHNYPQDAEVEFATVVHEISHIAWETVLNENERAIVEREFKRISSDPVLAAEWRRAVKGGAYSLRNSHEFFAVGFTHWVGETKFSKSLFERLSSVYRRVADAIVKTFAKWKMQSNDFRTPPVSPRVIEIYEKALAGDMSPGIASLEASRAKLYARAEWLKLNVAPDIYRHTAERLGVDHKNFKAFMDRLREVGKIHIPTAWREKFGEGYPRIGNRLRGGSDYDPGFLLYATNIDSFFEGLGNFLAFTERGFPSAAEKAHEEMDQRLYDKNPESVLFFRSDESGEIEGRSSVGWTVDQIGNFFSGKSQDERTEWLRSFLFNHPKDKNAKPDLSQIDLLVRTISSYAEKVPTTKRLFERALLLRDDKHVYGEEIFGVGEEDLIAISEFARTRKEEWAKLDDYIFQRDMEAKGYMVKPAEDGGFLILKPNGAEAGRGVTKAGAWRQAFDLEADDYVKAGGSEAAAATLKRYRMIAHRMFEQLLGEAGRLKQALEDMGMDMPTLDDGTDLFTALERMGDRRGHYMPRIRKNGRYVLKATKEGENPQRIHFDTKTGRNMAKASWERAGYKVEYEINKNPSEDVYLDASLANLNDLIQNALGRMSKAEDATFEDFDMTAEWTDYTRQNGQTERHFVVKAPKRSSWSAVFKDFGGQFYKKDGMWHFKDPSKAIKRQLLKAITANQYGNVLPAKAFARAFTDEMAAIILSRGSRARKIGRMDVKGKEVWLGYEPDALKALTLGGKATAGGTAKRALARDMMRIFTGTDIQWDSFKESKLAQYEADPNDPNQMAAIWDEYQELVKQRRLDSATQPIAYKDGLAYIKEMMRNEEPTERLVGMVRGLASLKHLSGVAPGVVNMTAMATTVPGAMKAFGNIPIRTAGRLVVKGLDQYTRFFIHEKFGKGKGIEGDPAEVGSAAWLMREINRRGWDEPLMNTEAIGLLKGRIPLILDKITGVALSVFSVTERVNRGATIAAAYHGLVEQKVAPAEALDRAKKISDKAHAIYGKENLPAWTRGGSVGAQTLRSFYMYKHFSHNYLQVLGEMIGKGEMKAAGYMLISPAIIGGAGASVATPALSAAAQALFSAIPGLEPPDDPEESFYRWAGETFGAPVEHVSRYGVAGVAGVNLKGSLRINIEDFVPTSIEDLLGAPYSIMVDFAYGAGHLARGDFMKGAEKIAPRVIAGPIRGTREYTEGVTTWNNQPVYWGEEQIRARWHDALLRWLSFNPARMSHMTEQLWNERQAENKYRDARTDLYARMRRFALSGGDKAQWAHILMDVEEYNQRVRRSPHDAIPFITESQIKSQIKRMKKPSRRERIRAGTAQREDPGRVALAPV